MKRGKASDVGVRGVNDAATRGKVKHKRDRACGESESKKEVVGRNKGVSGRGVVGVVMEEGKR